MRRKHFFLIGAAWLLCSVSACRQADSKATAAAIAPEKTFTDGLVQADTAAVLRLVNDYMGYARQGEYGKAAAMLYKPAPEDAWDEPLLLDNDEMAQVADMLRRRPVAAYKITDLEFRTAIDNEVKCVYSSAESSAMAYTLTFRPMNYLGGWRLCLWNGGRE